MKTIQTNIPIINPDVSFHFWIEYHLWWFLSLLLAGNSFQKVIKLNIEDIFLLVKDFTFDNKPKHRIIEKIAKDNGISCYSSFINTSSIIMSNETHLITKENRLIRYKEHRKPSWNISHPFFSKLIELDNNTQIKILDNLARLTEIDSLHDLIKNINPELLDTYHSLVEILQSKKELREFCDFILNRNPNVIDYEMLNNKDFNLEALFKEKEIKNVDIFAFFLRR